MERGNRGLEDVSVAVPCTEPWSEMTGSGRVRHCDKCSLNVYNLSAMTRAKAEKLIRSKEGRLCVRYYRRPDGTILTSDCSETRAAAIRARTAGLVALLLLVTTQWLTSCTSRSAVDEGVITRREIRSIRLGPLGKFAVIRATVNWLEAEIYPPPPPPQHEYWMTGIESS